MSASHSSGHLPRSSTLRTLLRRTPAILEPGLQVHRGVIELGGDETVHLFGTDAVGRPVLMLRERDFSNAFCDDFLQLVVRWSDDPEQHSARFPRAAEPRFIVICGELPEAAAQRLRLLRRAVPLRVRIVEEAFDPDGAARMRPAMDIALDLDARCAELEDDAAFALRRVLGAAAALPPALTVEGGDWPLVLRGVDGPCASLHRVDGELHFACSTANGPQVWRLQSEESVDRAIDLLMRRQNGVMAGV